MVIVNVKFNLYLLQAIIIYNVYETMWRDPIERGELN